MSEVKNTHISKKIMAVENFIIGSISPKEASVIIEEELKDSKALEEDFIMIAGYSQEDATKAAQAVHKEDMRVMF